MPAILSLVLTLIVGLLVAVPVALANATPQPLPFEQNFNNPELITADDDFSNVPGIVGFRGDNLTDTTGTDPQTVVGPDTVVNVVAKQGDPTISNGGIVEFDRGAFATNGTLAFQGSGTADAPNIVVNLDTSGQGTVRAQYNLRDIDAGFAGADIQAVQPVALQFRVGDTGDFTNVPDGFVANANAAGDTLVTAVDATLPADADDKPLVQVRIITTNAVGSDAFIGVDDISVTGTPILVSTPDCADGVDNDGDDLTDFAGGDPGCEDATDDTESPDPVTITPIREIQDSEQRSPLEGDTVTTTGIITAFRDFGFFMQDDDPDDSNATSEGIFVFTGSGNQPSEPAENGFAEGDRVQVTGEVVEFRSGSDDGDNLSETEISTSLGRITETGTGAIEPTIIGNDGREPPTEVIDNDSEETRDIEQVNEFEPNEDGIDFYESLEGMLVQVNAPLVVGPSQPQGFGEIPVLANDGASADEEDLTLRRGITIDPNGVTNSSNDPRIDFNPERVIFNDEVLRDDPTTAAEDENGDEISPLAPVDVGDSFNESLQGVISYSFGNFKAQLIENPTPENTNPPREETREPETNELAVSEFSLENLSPTQDEDDATDTRFEDAATQIVTNLKAPDIVALTEVQDNDGDNNGTDSTETDANVTADGLIAAIQEAGGPEYQYTDVDPEDDMDGSEPGGNIRVAYLYREDRGLDFVERGEAGPNDDTTVTSGEDGPQLSLSPGRVDPTDPAFEDSRKPLAAEFRYNGETVILVQSHFTSKGPDTSLFGRFQPPQLFSEPQRIAQAEAVRGFVEEVLAEDSEANVIVLSDLNDFEFSRPVLALKEGGVLSNLIDSVPRKDRYTSVFDGNSQVLDHMLISDNLRAFNSGAPEDFDIVHGSAEFADRRSDHDALVGFFQIDDDVEPTPTPSPTPSPSPTDPDEDDEPVADCTIIGTQGDDVLEGTSEADVICGLGGNDTIKSKKGRDTLDGGPGDDTIMGSRGRDTIFGGEGTDSLSGGRGGDFISGEPRKSSGSTSAGEDDGARDTLKGGRGKDTCKPSPDDNQKSCF